MRVRDVFPHGARVSVALVASRVLASIGFASYVSLHVFGSVTRVVEPLVASNMVAQIGLLTRVGPGVKFQVLQTRERTLARGDLAVVRFLSSVAAKVSRQFVTSIERFEFSGTVLPQADKLSHRTYVRSVQMGHQTSERRKLLMTIAPHASHMTIT